VLQSTEPATKFTASTELVVPENDRVVPIVSFTIILARASGSRVGWGEREGGDTMVSEASLFFLQIHGPWPEHRSSRW